MGRYESGRRMKPQEIPKPLYADGKGSTGSKPWIPIAGLPLDLQLTALRSPGLVMGNVRVRVRVAPTWLQSVAASVALIALIAVFTTSDKKGFGSFTRAAGLLGGGALGGIVLAWRRALGFRPAAGRKLLIGPASLVLVEARSVWVIPAEELVSEWNSIHHRSELIYRSDFMDSEWNERLGRVIKLATASEALRDSDRFRKAAAQAVPISRLSLLWTSHEPQIVAAGLALSAALFLEAGPLHARGVEVQESSAAAAALGKLESNVDVGRERAIRLVTMQVEATTARKVRAELLDDALTKSEGAARAFLVKYPVDELLHEERARVMRRLSEFCAARFSMPKFDSPSNHLLRVVLRLACESADGGVHYTTAGDSSADVAQLFMAALATSAAKLSSQVSTLEAMPLDPNAPGIPAAQSAAGVPSVRLAMRSLGPEREISHVGRVQEWHFDVVPVDALDVPIVGADFHGQWTVNRTQGTIKMAGSN